MKRKRRIATTEIYKWKARLNVHGGKQEYGVHYWETYSPVVQQNSIHMFLILSILQNWHTLNWISYSHIPRPTPRQNNTWICLSASTSEVNQICLMHYYLSRTYMEARPAEQSGQITSKRVSLALASCNLV